MTIIQKGELMDDLIRRQAAIDLVKDVCEAILSKCGSHYDGEDEVYDDPLEVDAVLKCNKEIRVALRHMSSAQPDKGYIEQVKWERDTAIAQLEELGYGLGEKIRTATDTISRQAAIDALRKLSREDGYINLPHEYVTDAVRALPSAQAETHGKRTKTHACDCISRQGAIEVIDAVFPVDPMKSEYAQGIACGVALAKTYVEQLPSAQPEPQWIPFKTRPLTEEEKEEYPEWNCILDCKLPDDGQTILVSISLRGHERVQYDEFYSDDGSYLDSGYAIGEEATAWMPLPEPYKEKDNERA